MGKTMANYINAYDRALKKSLSIAQQYYTEITKKDVGSPPSFFGSRSTVVSSKLTVNGDSISLEELGRLLPNSRTKRFKRSWSISDSTEDEIGIVKEDDLEKIREMEEKIEEIRIYMI